jgi:osmotically-inducible protein OsmY
MYRSETRSQDDERSWQDRRERQEDDYSRRDLQSNQQSGSTQTREEQWRQGRSSGNWTGYVVPYRYYGPGYRGVGYYSVMYLGPSQSEAESQGEFDQREVDYGQGQGAGAAWTGRGERGGSSMQTGYAGRGPKGYQRRDERIQEEISDRLMADNWIDASNIEVSVKGGEVTLSGTVDNREAKRRSEDIAESVMGVREVMNQIRIQGTESRSRTSTSGSGRTSRNGGRSGDQQSSTTGGTSRSQSTR